MGRQGHLGGLAGRQRPGATRAATGTPTCCSGPRPPGPASRALCGTPAPRSSTGSSSSARRWTRSSPHPGKPQEGAWREGRGIEAGAGSPNLPLGVCGCWAGVSWTALGVARPSSTRALQDQRAGPAQTPWDQPSCDPEHTSALAPGSQPTGHRQLRNPKSKRLLSQQTSRPRQGCSQEVAQQF
jgi:hypothetical protein